MDPQFIRNFCIIAHIDHGKSTLADRLLELTGALTQREMTAQVLDSMDLERERGITIKAKSIRLHYTAKDGHEYRLNLIDTPGHVDFSYEVSRALSACEGALLVVDASQGVEAQTVANAFLASRHNLTIVPVINKIDLPAAQTEYVKEQIENVLAIPADDALPISAKSGLGVAEVLEAIVQRVPPPKGSADAPLQALIFDSWFDSYRGAVVLVRVMEGRIAPRMKIRLCVKQRSLRSGESRRADAQADRPRRTGGRRRGLHHRQHQARGRRARGRHGDRSRPPGASRCRASKPSSRWSSPASIPVNASDYELLRDALGKLQLNDAAFFYEPENSVALGFGFRCGFLGLLHMEIVQERLEREFNIDLITTAPSVEFRITTTAGEVIEVDNPTKFPPPTSIQKIEEPILTAMIITSEESVGGVLKLCEEKRGVQKNFEYLSPTRVMLTYEMPLNEIVLDFYDRLKSVSRGYASLDYHLSGYRESDLVKLDVLVGGEPVDALTDHLPPRPMPTSAGAIWSRRLRKLIPRQMFEVPIQAAIGSRIIARETISAIRKNVLAKCYGGDIIAQTQAARKAKRRQKAHEARRPRRHPAGSLSRGAQSRRHHRRRLVIRGLSGLPRPFRSEALCRGSASRSVLESDVCFSVGATASRARACELLDWEINCCTATGLEFVVALAHLFCLASSPKLV